MNTVLTLLLALMPVAGPFKEVPALMGQAKENSSVSINDLRRAPTEVVLDGKSLSLSAYPWRDFMPTISDIPLGPDGKPMAVVLKVTTSDRKPLPSGVRADRVWVLFGEQVWEISELKQHAKGIPSNKDSREEWINCPDLPVCEFTVRDGPKWGPGDFVDVVVRLTDKDGRRYLLQAPKQLVKRSD